MLALENLPRTCIGNTAEEIGYFTGRIPQLRLCLDTNHFTSPRPDVRFRPFQRRSVRLRRRLNPVPPKDNEVEFARRFAGRIVTVHLSDYDGIDECHWLLGQGCVDFKGIQHSLLDAGFDSPMIFEPNERCRGVRTTGKRLIRRYEKQAGILR